MNQKQPFPGSTNVTRATQSVTLFGKGWKTPGTQADAETASANVMSAQETENEHFQTWDKHRKPAKYKNQSTLVLGQFAHVIFDAFQHIVVVEAELTAHVHLLTHVPQ